MMSVHFWGEPVLSPTYGGVWSLTLNNAGNRPCILNDWGMTFYGTRLDPQPGVSIRPVFMVCFEFSIYLFYSSDSLPIPLWVKMGHRNLNCFCSKMGLHQCRYVT